MWRLPAVQVAATCVFLHSLRCAAAFIPSLARSHGSRCHPCYQASPDASPSEGLPPKPLFRFGVISDIQYADQPAGRSHSGRPRYYRDALTRLQDAAEHWRREGLEFAIHMGDIIDGQNAQTAASSTALEEVLSCFETVFNRSVFHVLGNHCLYCLPRPMLNERLGLLCGPEPACAYQAYVHKGFRFLFLDGYDISVLWPEGHPKREAAKSILRARNPNRDNMNNPAGLEGLARRFVAFGGGIGETQMRWIRENLDEARSNGERVIVCSHQAIHPGSADGLCLLWNYDDVLTLLEEYGGDTVVATLAGHAHRYGQHDCTSSGITHRVLEAVLEAPPGLNAYGWIDVFPDRLVLRGHGIMKDMTVRFRDAGSAKPKERQRAEEAAKIV